MYEIYFENTNGKSTRVIKNMVSKIDKLFNIMSEKKIHIFNIFHKYTP